MFRYEEEFKNMLMLYKLKREIYSGGGSYDLEGNQKKIGQWVELDDYFDYLRGLAYNGEYNIKGLKTCIWLKMDIKYNIKKEKRNMMIENNNTFIFQILLLSKFIIIYKVQKKILLNLYFIIQTIKDFQVFYSLQDKKIEQKLVQKSQLINVYYVKKIGFRMNTSTKIVIQFDEIINLRIEQYNDGNKFPMTFVLILNFSVVNVIEIPQIVKLVNV
ncbi:unnamed protein product [Paramecium sonneborni]|uniref:Uncharacterized protein n=1 Tax=Paramecium sonneborni TaxID=65129 RepID=A0A8S1QAQ9_9CILI|nr:unnamed protein product [Paramecium sonneborni]